jgi:hypothetical protein
MARFGKSAEPPPALFVAAADDLAGDQHLDVILSGRPGVGAGRRRPAARTERPPRGGLPLWAGQLGADLLLDAAASRLGPTAFGPDRAERLWLGDRLGVVSGPVSRPGLPIPLPPAPPSRPGSCKCSDLRSASGFAAPTIAVAVQVELVGTNHSDRALHIVGTVAGAASTVIVTDADRETFALIGGMAVL